jgi:hypothetical protein
MNGGLKRLPCTPWGEHAVLVNLYKRVCDSEHLVPVNKETAGPRVAEPVVIMKTGSEDPRTIIRPVTLEKNLNRRSRQADIAISNGRFVVVTS